MAQDFRNALFRQIGTADQALLAGGNYDAVIGIRCCNILTSTIDNTKEEINTEKIDR